MKKKIARLLRGFDQALIVDILDYLLYGDCTNLILQSSWRSMLESVHMTMHILTLSKIWVSTAII